jgi:hypothetical protein
MTSYDPAESERRALYLQLRHHLSPAGVHVCRQVAWSLKGRWPLLLQSADCKDQLLREIRAAMGRQSMQSMYLVLGSGGDADIEAILFVVMMEAAHGADEDLKDIMQGVKASNNAKAQQRALLQERQNTDLQHDMRTAWQDQYRNLLQELVKRATGRRHLGRN